MHIFRMHINKPSLYSYLIKKKKNANIRFLLIWLKKKRTKQNDRRMKLAKKFGLIMNRLHSEIFRITCVNYVKQKAFQKWVFEKSSEFH